MIIRWIPGVEEHEKEAMAPLTDTAILEKFRLALSEWNCTGHITWKSISRECVEANLEGFTTRAVGEAMFNYVETGGKIDLCGNNPG